MIICRISGEPDSLPSCCRRAFTRIELLAVLIALGVLVAVAWPGLAHQRERSLRVLCADNLRQLGQSFQRWGLDHQGRPPCRTPWCEGGTYRSGCRGTEPSVLSAGLNLNLWFQWYWMSNEVQSPRILACPSDTAKRPAKDWSLSPTDGFLHANARNGAVSYFIALDVFSLDNFGLLSGDRNVRFDGVTTGCSSGVNPSSTLYLGPPTNAGIEANLHVEQGNFLLTDGRVEEISSIGLVKRMREIYGLNDNGAAHYLTP